jgi:PTS system nitrogen regulatory IIA component
MNKISQLIPERNLLLNVEASSKKRLFEQTGLMFENHHGLASSRVFESLFARERLGSTGLGSGVAIPHGRIKGLKHALGAFVRLAKPLPFDAPDGQPVSLVFFLLVPQNANQEHLELLSELAEMLSDEDFRSRLTSANDSAQAHRLMQDWQSGHGSHGRSALC